MRCPTGQTTTKKLIIDFHQNILIVFSKTTESNWHAQYEHWKYGQFKSSMFSHIEHYIKIGKERRFALLWILMHIGKIQYCMLLKHEHLWPKRWRKRRRTQLLINFITPYLEITSLTISKCIKDTSSLNGVNKLGKFSDNWTHFSAASKANIS